MYSQPVHHALLKVDSRRSRVLKLCPIHGIFRCHMHTSRHACSDLAASCLVLYNYKVLNQRHPLVQCKADKSKM